jgi:hypothetical protein
MKKVDAKGSDPDTTAKLQQVLSELSTPEVRTAAVHIGDWMSQNCKK